MSSNIVFVGSQLEVSRVLRDSREGHRARLVAKRTRLLILAQRLHERRGGGISQPTLMSRALAAVRQPRGSRRATRRGEVRADEVLVRDVVRVEGGAVAAFSYSDSPRAPSGRGRWRWGEPSSRSSRGPCARDCASAARTSPCCREMSAMATMGPGPGPHHRAAAEPAPFARNATTPATPATPATAARTREVVVAGLCALGADAGAAP